MMTKTAPDTITDMQIRALRREAQDAGDWAQAAICGVALDDLGDNFGLARADARRIKSMTYAQARAECARIIADAEAQLPA